VEPQYQNGRVRSGSLISQSGEHSYTIRDFVPRFVPADNYAENFGMQWNRFRRTQLDSFSGMPISADRFWHATGWDPSDLAGHWVLDIGCGAGRFAEVACRAGAQVVAVDYSSAVDACFANLSQFPGFHVVQGDIYSLPIQRGLFQFVYSLGVLQHTPDVGRAFAALPPMLHPGGRLCVDFYEKSWKSALLPKYWLRPITKRMPKRRLFAMCEALVPILLPISGVVGRVPRIGKHLRRLIPVANHAGTLPLRRDQLAEWSLLDTFDWLSPEFDNPQRPETIRCWLERAGLTDVQVLKAGHLTGRGRAPNAGWN
jgi:2-polyprenyl-3-methyl-5-hydroxy-6-metoxy-1,4-benzoquinol methylase